MASQWSILRSASVHSRVNHWSTCGRLQYIVINSDDLPLSEDLSDGRSSEHVPCVQVRSQMIVPLVRTTPRHGIRRLADCNGT